MLGYSVADLIVTDNPTKIFQLNCLISNLKKLLFVKRICPRLLIISIGYYYRAMHFSAYALSWDRMSSVCPSVCDIGGL